GGGRSWGLGFKGRARGGGPAEKKRGGGRPGPAVEDEADRPPALGCGEPVVGMEHLRCGPLLFTQYAPLRDHLDVGVMASIARPGQIAPCTFRRLMLLFVLVGC